MSLEMGQGELLDPGAGGWGEISAWKGREGSREEVNFWAVGDGRVTERYLGLRGCVGGRDRQVP